MDEQWPKIYSPVTGAEKYIFNKKFHHDIVVLTIVFLLILIFAHSVQLNDVFILFVVTYFISTLSLYRKHRHYSQNFAHATITFEEDRLVVKKADKMEAILLYEDIGKIEAFEVRPQKENGALSALHIRPHKSMRSFVTPIKDVLSSEYSTGEFASRRESILRDRKFLTINILTLPPSVATKILPLLLRQKENKVKEFQG